MGKSERIRTVVNSMLGKVTKKIFSLNASHVRYRRRDVKSIIDEELIRKFCGERAAEKQITKEIKMSLPKRQFMFEKIILTRLSTFNPKFDFFHAGN